MSKQYNYAFKITRANDTYKSLTGEYLYPGPTTEDEYFMALVRCLATYPSKFANLKDDEVVIFKDERNIDPANGRPKTFIVGWL